MLNTIGSLCGADSAGILDCISYTAGVSGEIVSRRLLYVAKKVAVRQLLGSWSNALRSRRVSLAIRYCPSSSGPHSNQLS
jgi:hypothetical protein